MKYFYNSLILLPIVVAATLLLIQLTDGSRILANKCSNEGSRCHGGGKQWQHDGICKRSSNGDLQCIAPATQTMRLIIISQYRTLRIKNRNNLVTEMYIRGSGPGLSWEKSIKMKKSATVVDQWRVELEYTVNSNGMTCLSSTHCSHNQRALEFRIYTDETEEKSMMGPNFFVPLPISQSLTGAASFLTPSVTVYPWFLETSIEPKDVSIQLQHRLEGSNITLNCSILYPPSFNENVRKNYPLAIILMPQKQSKYIIPPLEQLLYEATMEEVLVITVEAVGHSECDYHPFLHSFEPRCKAAPPCFSCQKCWDPQRTEACEKPEFMNLAQRCLWMASCKGIGGLILEGIQHRILPELMQMTANRLEVNFPHDRLTIIGYGTAGVLACYAAITRPTIFKNAACMSPKFFLPINKDLSFNHSIKEILKDKHDLLTKDSKQSTFYKHQKYYIDHGENDNFFFPLIDSITNTNEVVKQMKKSLKLNDHDNIIQAELADVSMDYMSNKWKPDIGFRLRIPFMHFFKAAGGPNKKFARTLELTELSYAERNLHARKQTTTTDQDTVPGSTETTIDSDVTGGILEPEKEEKKGKATEVKRNMTCNDVECDKHQVSLPMFCVSIGKSV